MITEGTKMTATNGKPVLMLGEDDLERLGLGQVEIVDCLTDAIRKEAAGKVWTTPKSVLLPGDGRYLMTTLSASDDPGVSVVKMVQVSPDNPDRGLPAINGTILIHDSDTGLLKAVLDANWVTAVRTAGLGGVAARALANPDSRRIGFIGTGVQARSHLDMFAAHFPIAEIAIYGRGQANIDRLAEKAGEMGLGATVCGDPREALDGADLVVTSVTLTTVSEPFLDAGWLKPGAFAAITDLAAPWKQESFSALGRAVIDDAEQEAASESNMIDPGLVAGDLKALATGGVKVGYDPDQSSAFIFRGLATGDFAVSALALQRASQG